jgi:hypothetical protein
MSQLYWMADNDPIKINAYLSIPLTSYWQILDNRLAQYEKDKNRKK